MDRKIIKDASINSIIGILETTGILAVLLIVIMPVLAIIGFVKRGLKKF